MSLQENDTFKRSPRMLYFLKHFLSPILFWIFNLRNRNQILWPHTPFMLVANHNSGALFESHVILCLSLHKNISLYGFTHPSLFKIPLLNSYFKSIGAVPATDEIAKLVFQSGNSLLVFPGGNSQALRTIWRYQEKSFRNNHGWARIANQNRVPVVVAKFSRTHFSNPILVSNSLISKILILPWLLKIKTFPISLGQIFWSILIFILGIQFGIPIFITLVLSYFGFILTVLLPVIPVPMKLEISNIIDTNSINIKELEERVAQFLELDSKLLS